jgi:hypothetical protein
MELMEKLRKVANRLGVLPGQLSLAWVQAQGDDVFPIPGTKRVKACALTLPPLLAPGAEEGPVWVLGSVGREGREGGGRERGEGGKCESPGPACDVAEKGDGLYFIHSVAQLGNVCQLSRM